jgi:hypothetical protein
MTVLPEYFTQSSHKSYDRHHYKVVSTAGESIAVESYDQAQAIWFQKKVFLSHIEILDKPKAGTGF